MTDKEIVQALRCCTDHSCSAKCPAFPAGLDCREEMHKEVLALLERLTAENAALREKVPQWISVEADRLRELAEADKDGRVIVLPAKKGDTWKKAMSSLDKKYAEAKKLPFIRDPLAWALYRTWKEFDDGKRCD